MIFYIFLFSILENNKFTPNDSTNKIDKPSLSKKKIHIDYIKIIIILVSAVAVIIIIVIIIWCIRKKKLSQSTINQPLIITAQPPYIADQVIEEEEEDKGENWLFYIYNKVDFSYFNFVFLFKKKIPLIIYLKKVDVIY